VARTRVTSLTISYREIATQPGVPAHPYLGRHGHATPRAAAAHDEIAPFHKSWRSFDITSHGIDIQPGGRPRPD